MQRWSSGFRSLAAQLSNPEFHSRRCLFLHQRHHIYSDRLLHISPRRLLHIPQMVLHSPVSPNFKPFLHSPPIPDLSHSTNFLPTVYLIQVRNITAKQRERKLKSRKPRTPVVSKVKKIKMKFYSSFKGRFRVMNDGLIRRWKEGKRHNAHLKSKKSKRRLRQPGIVPAAYAKVMKKLNFCN